MLGQEVQATTGAKLATRAEGEEPPRVTKDIESWLFASFRCFYGYSYAARHSASWLPCARPLPLPHSVEQAPKDGDHMAPKGCYGCETGDAG